MKVHGVLLGASMLALTWTGTAAAQTAAPAQNDAPQTTAAPSDTAAPVAAENSNQGDTTSNGTSGQDIIVTAGRRSENLARTPIAAAVLNGADLTNRGIAAVDQLQFNMPSVTVNNFGQGLEFNIRGIGKAEHNTQTTTGVITYRDGVATFPGYFQEEPYFDIASVEVLRGPQGTIAGQNSTGGAVFVSTNDPNFNGIHGYVMGSYGNYNDANLQGAINVPLSDTLAARVALFGERRDSFYTIHGPNGSRYPYNPGDLREAAGRFSLLWRPTEQLSILSKTDLDYIDMGGYPANPYYENFSTLPGDNGRPNPFRRDLFDITANSPQQARDKFLRETLRIDYNLGGGLRFRSVSGFQNGNTQYQADLDGVADTTTPYTLANGQVFNPRPAVQFAPTFVAAGNNSTFFDTVDETAFSQEFNLISPDNQRFTYLIGAYAQWNTYFFSSPYQFQIDTQGAAPPSPFPTVPILGPGAAANVYSLEGRNRTRSLAAFGQVGYDITPRLKITLGGRYTDFQTRNNVRVRQYGTPITDNETASYRNFSYKASLGWTVDSDNFVYAFVATGFRPGGLNVPVGFGNNQPFDSEKVTSFEAGWKGDFFDRHVRTSLTGFYNNYRNFQVIVGYPDVPVFGIELNVPNTTHLYGAEAEIDAHVGHLTLSAGASVLHSELGQFFAVDPRLGALNAGACNIATGPASPAGTPAPCTNLKGRQQTYAPNFTFNVSAAYEIPMGGGATLTPRVNFGHIGAQWATLFENSALGDRLEDRNILGAQVAYTTAHGLTISAYGTNLTDQHYVGALSSNLNYAGPPRQYGLRVTKLF